MIIDSHYHYESRVQTVENLLEKMNQNGIDKTVLISPLNELLPHTEEYLLKLLRFALWNKPLRWIARKLSSTFNEKGELVVQGNPVKIIFNPDNTPVAELIKQYPEKFLGWIFVNPNGSGDFMKEYENWKDTPGFIGVKTHPFWHRYAPIDLSPVAEDLEKTGKPLLMHAGFGPEGDFIALADRFPNLKIILAHAGFPCFKDTWHQIKSYKNIYVDLAADAYVNEKVTLGVVDYLGKERVLYGTDGPYGNRLASDGVFDNGFLKRRLESLFPDKKTQALLLGENFLKIADL